MIYKKRLQLFLLATISCICLFAQRRTSVPTNIYSSTSTSSQIIAHIAEGSPVKVIKSKGTDWIYIEANGKRGYVKANNVTQFGSSNATTARRVASKSRQQPDITPAVSSRAAHIELSGEEIYMRCSKAVFIIVTKTEEHISQGSGFFIGRNGLAVSNYHVLKDLSEDNFVGYGIKLPINNSQMYGIKEVLYLDEENDCIIFRVDHNNETFIPLANSRPRIGEKVYAIGSPQGWENSISEGIVSQWRNDNTIIQTTVSIDHGSSGGALINIHGEAVGITSGTLNRESVANLNYARSIDVFRTLVSNKNWN